jgi:hypothetical protein
MTVLKLVAGIVGAMFMMYGIFYSPRGRYPRYAAAAAILTGFFMSLVALWVYLHP